MKKTGLLKILTISTIVIALLTWLIQANYFSGSMQNFGLLRVGFFDLLNYPILTFYYFEQELLFMLTVGGFYGVISKTGKYRNAVEKCAKLFKNKEGIFLVGVAFILAGLNAFLGYGLLLFLFIPFLCAVIIMMGYDKITALLVTFLSPLIGIIGSVYSENVNSYLNNITGLDKNACLIYQIVLFVLVFALYAYFILKHAKKSKKDVKAELIEQDPYIGEKTTSKKASTGIVITLLVIFVLLVLACTKWETMFGITKFSEIHNYIMNEITINDTKIFAILFGTIGAFGEWSYTEIIISLLIISVIVGKVYKLKISDIYSAFAKGAKEVLEPAIFVTLAMTIVVITANHPIYPTILDFVMSMFDKLNVLALIPAGILTSLGSFLNVDMIYLSQTSVPYLVSLYTSESALKVITILTQSVHGLTMLIAPTSTFLILGLEYLNISYKEWIKKSWKLILGIAVIIFIVCATMVLM